MRDTFYKSLLEGRECDKTNKTDLAERDLFDSWVWSVKPFISTFASQWASPGQFKGMVRENNMQVTLNPTEDFSSLNDIVLTHLYVT